MLNVFQCGINGGKDRRAIMQGRQSDSYMFQGIAEEYDPIRATRSYPVSPTSIAVGRDDRNDLDEHEATARAVARGVARGVAASQGGDLHEEMGISNSMVETPRASGHRTNNSSRNEGRNRVIQQVTRDMERLDVGNTRGSSHATPRANARSTPTNAPPRPPSAPCPSAARYSRKSSYPEIENDPSIEESLQFSTGSSVKFLEEMGISQEIDLDFVEEYDNAFNEFLAKYPRFLIDSPDLVHNLRIIKLQKLLEHQDESEADYTKKLEEITLAKSQMESGWHEQLREAARKKAARETHLQSYLGGIHYSTKCMEAQLTWHLLCDTENRTKQQHLLLRQLQSIEVGRDRFNLLGILPEGHDSIRDAMLAPAGQTLSEEQEKDLRQFQMDNAFLVVEANALRKKVAQLKVACKKYAWVESVLLRMDEKSFKKLKSSFKKRTGVSL